MDAETPTLSSDQGDTGPTSLLDPSINWVEPEPTGADSPPASSPEADATSAPSPEAATEPPVGTPREGAQAESGQQQGPIPFDRHQAILAKEREERDRLSQRVAWAEELTKSGYTPDQIRDAISTFEQIGQAPDKFFEGYYQSLVNDPRYGPQMRSAAARILAGHRSQAESDPEPQPDWQDRTTGQAAYSPEQMRKWQEWHSRQLEAKLGERIAPLETERQQREEQARLAQWGKQAYDESYQATTREIEETIALPHCKERLSDIKAYLKETATQDGLYTKSFKDAYLHVLTTKVLPELSQTERAKTLTEMKTKAAAGRQINPREAATATPKAPTSFRDPSLKWD